MRIPSSNFSDNSPPSPPCPVRPRTGGRPVPGASDDRGGETRCTWWDPTESARKGANTTCSFGTCSRNWRKRGSKPNSSNCPEEGFTGAPPATDALRQDRCSRRGATRRTADREDFDGADGILLDLPRTSRRHRGDEGAGRPGGDGRTGQRERVPAEGSVRRWSWFEVRAIHASTRWTFFPSSVRWCPPDQATGNIGCRPGDRRVEKDGGGADDAHPRADMASLLNAERGGKLNGAPLKVGEGAGSGCFGSVDDRHTGLLKYVSRGRVEAAGVADEQLADRGVRSFAAARGAVTVDHADRTGVPRPQPRSNGR